jgi:hypothetical protein
MALHESHIWPTGVEKISPAKAQRRKENLQNRGSAWRLCALAGEIFFSASTTFRAS